ncbi:hypothetical protein C1J03_02275 [Sulfitobacter sp. SK012]|uniref:VPLPA-CTERM sorting domain-containing protein n=1 Tax=Sulfitobacter sp. SK012 TaxID=1389005 RepID=UPI000E0BD2CF|nr:VPLPA-CTERM sorting domain-containing protein [Sulfitobacter sp. SK012]AXI48706.1 hypothetical protein C1J03_02275 [Sulfitobacter sp. SK012]
MSIFKMAAVAAIVSTAGGAASAATFQIYTDRTAYEAALLGPIAIYDFTGGAPASGVTITGSDVSYTPGGRLRDIINQGAAADTLFAFDAPVLAFGGDWNLEGPGGPGTGIEIQTMNGATYTVSSEVPNTLRNDFWGFISDMEFSSLSFVEGSQAIGVETYTLDNLTTGGVAPVPLPAGLPLLLAGLGGLATLRRKRKAA